MSIADPLRQPNTASSSDPFEALQGTPKPTADSRSDHLPIGQFGYVPPKGERGYPPFVRAAVRASAGLEPAPISGEECLHVLKSIFAFYEAAQTGRAQTVS